MYDTTEAETFEGINQWMQQIKQVCCRVGTPPLAALVAPHSQPLLVLRCTDFLLWFVQHGEENVNKLLIANKCDYPEADRVRPAQ